MKHAIAILLVLGFLGSPIGCLLADCQVPNPAHDCCPKEPAARAGCPYDLISLATPTGAISTWMAMPAAAEVGFIAEAFLPTPAVSIAPDGRDLHLQIRLLRI